MPWFRASTTSSGVVTASRAEVWSVLTDPSTVASLTPLVSRIHADGDLWRWEMTSVPVLGRSFTPRFTERMTFTDKSRIEFTHEPRRGAKERTGVEGCYSLEDVSQGTHLCIELTVDADLPIPRAADPAVRAAMKAVMATMGVGFERHFRRKLGEPGGE